VGGYVMKVNGVYLNDRYLGDVLEELGPGPYEFAVAYKARPQPHQLAISGRNADKGLCALTCLRCERESAAAKEAAAAARREEREKRKRERQEVHLLY